MLFVLLNSTVFSDCLNFIESFNNRTVLGNRFQAREDVYENDFLPPVVFMNRVASKRSTESWMMRISVKYAGDAPMKNLCTNNNTLNSVLCLIESQCKSCKTVSVTGILPGRFLTRRAA